MPKLTRSDPVAMLTEMTWVTCHSIDTIIADS